MHRHCRQTSSKPFLQVLTDHQQHTGTMYTKVLSIALAAAFLGLAAAQVPAVCSNEYSYKLSDFPESVDAVRFQTLDAVTVRINEDVSKPTLVVYRSESDVEEPFKPLNVKVEGSELLIGAANNDRSQCIHLELPDNMGGVESILADDGTNVLLDGTFNVQTLKLVVVKGSFYSNNDTNTAFSVQSLTLNNTGVGSIFFTDSGDSATELEILNINGLGDTFFLGTANDVEIRHEGFGNIFLGAVSNELLVHLTGQGDIATHGSTTLAISGIIRHPYKIFYKDGSDKICADLEVDMNTDGFEPCQQEDDPIAFLENREATTFSG